MPVIERKSSTQRSSSNSTCGRGVRPGRREAGRARWDFGAFALPLQMRVMVETSCQGYRMEHTARKADAAPAAAAPEWRARTTDGASRPGNQIVGGRSDEETVRTGWTTL